MRRRALRGARGGVSGEHQYIIPCFEPEGPTLTVCRRAARVVISRRMRSVFTIPRGPQQRQRRRRSRCDKFTSCWVEWSCQRFFLLDLEALLATGGGAACPDFFRWVNSLVLESKGSLQTAHWFWDMAVSHWPATAVPALQP